MDMGFFLQKERIFPGVHQIGALISGPRIADTNFTDTRIFLKQLKGKIVSELFTLFALFSHFFGIFSPRTFPFKTKGFSSMRTK